MIILSVTEEEFKEITFALDIVISDRCCSSEEREFPEQLIENLQAQRDNQ